MNASPTPFSQAGSHEVTGSELRKEGYTMALYVAVCLLAALMAISDTSGRNDAEVAGVVWGTTIGLALAHLFAFRMSARLVGSGQVQAHDAQIAAVQLVGAATVAGLCSVAIVVFDASSELDAVRLVLAGYVALVGHQVAMSNGSTRVRAVVYGVVILLVAFTIALLKNSLSGH